jgi:hypothetical protein
VLSEANQGLRAERGLSETVCYQGFRRADYRVCKPEVRNRLPYTCMKRHVPDEA